MPIRQCGKEGQPPCEGTGCIEGMSARTAQASLCLLQSFVDYRDDLLTTFSVSPGSIVIESQDPVECSEYLGANYIGAGESHRPHTNNSQTSLTIDDRCNLHLHHRTLSPIPFSLPIAPLTPSPSQSRTITETWTVGGFLSIDTSDLAPVSVQAGFFSSFSKATTVGTNTGISQTCGDEGSTGNFTCGMHIKPQCFAMAGYCDTVETGRVPWVRAHEPSWC